ncbi:MAG: VWA domain-containing protein [Acidobacteria bacterium]|nr:VWA domain-containing protein [Acidobacteriota bacterium]
MKYSLVARCLVVLLLVAGVSAPVSAQSGRKRQTQPQSPTTTQNKTQKPQSSDQDSDRSDREDDKKSSDKPLVDNTPTTVTDDGTIKLETSLITIPATVLNREGRFIPNLKKRDFRIYEDSVEQDIASFQSIEVPFHVVLLLDTSASTRFKHEDIQAAALAFVKQLRWNDKVMIVSFDSTVNVWCDFTSDRDQLESAIYKTRTGGSTKLYEAVDLGISEFLAPIKGRKAIVLFTDGVDTASRRSSARSTVSLVQESDVLVYPIRYDTEADNAQSGGVIMGNPGPGGLPLPWPRNPRNPPPTTPPTRNPRWPFSVGQLINYQFPGQWPQGPLPTPSGTEDYRRAERYLQDLADYSGGELHQADTIQNLTDAFSNIAEELRNQYALSYYPTNSVRDGSYRQIKVRVNRTGAIVRARPGYRAVPETQAKDESQKENRKKPGYKRKQAAGTN